MNEESDPNQVAPKRTSMIKTVTILSWLIQFAYSKDGWRTIDRKGYRIYPFLSYMVIISPDNLRVRKIVVGRLSLDWASLKQQPQFNPIQPDEKEEAEKPTPNN